MTEIPDRPDLTPDELASAHVDGIAPPEQAARIEADPALRARVARLQAARDAVRVPDLPPDADRREAAIAAALAAGVGRSGEAPADELAARRRRSTRRLGWVAAVAAAVALAVVLPRVIDGDSGSDDTTVAAAPKSADQDAAGRATAGAGESAPLSADAGAAASAAAPDAGSTTTAYVPGPLADLGATADLEGLAEPARRALDGSTATGMSGSTASPEDTACLRDQAATARAPAQPGDQPPTVILSATASVDGERALALVIRQPDGTLELIAFKADGCSLLGTIAL